MIAALRLALRRLLRQPGPALSALLTLGLAMGASIALYSVLQTVLLRLISANMICLMLLKFTKI